MHTGRFLMAAVSVGIVSGACSNASPDPVETGAETQQLAAIAGEPDASTVEEQPVASEQPAADEPRPALLVAVAGEDGASDTAADGSTTTAGTESTDDPDTSVTTVAPATTTSAAPATTVAPGTQAPTSQAATTRPPTTLAPSTQAPSTQAPTTRPPVTQPPTTQAPTTQPPTTQPPTTQASGTETRDVVNVLALPTYGGGSFDPSTLKGKPVLIWFWGPF